MSNFIYIIINTGNFFKRSWGGIYPSYPPPFDRPVDQYTFYKCGIFFS